MMSFCVIFFFSSSSHSPRQPQPCRPIVLSPFFFHAQFDGNAVTMLPFSGSFFFHLLLNDTSAHFLSAVKIQCHVQSLFINRNEMLALRCGKERVAWRSSGDGEKKKCIKNEMKEQKSFHPMKDDDVMSPSPGGRTSSKAK